MNVYGLSQADREIQQTAREFIDSVIPYEEYAELHEGQLPAGIAQQHQDQAIKLGLYATNMPASVGGRGCTMLQQVLVQEQGGRASNALGWVMHTPPAWWPEVANDFQRERWLLPTVQGEMHECYAITEEFAGSDVDDLASTARRDGADYLLNGVKWHVTSYNEANYAFFQGKLVGGEHDGEHAMFVVDVPSPGVEVVRSPAYTHTIAHHHPIVSFTDVRVPASHLVGREGVGMTFSHDWFRFERLMVAARCAGAAQRLLDEVTAFATARRVGGAPLSDYQLVAAMLADIATELLAARTLLYEVARGVDAGADRKVLHAQASMAKLYCSEMANRSADRAVQIFGGRGYMRENVAERFYRELRVERIWEGASELQRLIVARQLVKLGPERLLG